MVFSANPRMFKDACLFLSRVSVAQVVLGSPANLSYNNQVKQRESLRLTIKSDQMERVGSDSLSGESHMLTQLLIGEQLVMPSCKCK